MNKAILTPCIGVCELNADNICTGCYRTKEEITYWSVMSDQQRDYIMNTILPERELRTL